MHEQGHADRGIHRAHWGALALSGLLPLVELGRIALSESAAGLLIAAVVVALCLPLHLRHVAYALHGERAPRAGWSFAVMAVLMALPAGGVSASWGWMMSTLAVSVLLAVRAPWSLALFGSALALAYVEGTASYVLDEGTGDRLYLAASIAFRSLCLFVVIRLVAEARTLDRTRHAVARAAVERQRADTALRLTSFLVRDLERLGATAARLHAPRDVAAPVRDLVREAQRLLGEVRVIAERTRGVEARRALADAGRLLRGAAEGGEAGQEQHPPIEGRASTGLNRSMALLVLVRFVVVGICLAFASGVSFLSPLPAWAFGAILVTAAVESRRALRTALSMPLDRVPLSTVLVAAASVPAVLLVHDPSQFTFSMALVAATCVMDLRGGWRSLGAAAALLALFGYGLLSLSALDPSAAVVAWYLAYVAAVSSLAVGSLIASVHLVQAVRALEASRDLLAEQAVDAEDRRFARDLHDTLVQSLSAVALTGELVLRLADRDEAAAAIELERLRSLTAGLAEDARRVSKDQRAVSLAEEAQAAAQLLRAAGVVTDVRLSATPQSAGVDALLGWAVREAATNVVRHSAATRCVIAVTDDDGHLGLLVANDGVPQQLSGTGAGSGLEGLADRARDLRGTVHAEASDIGEFRLRVRVPQEVA